MRVCLRPVSVCLSDAHCDHLPPSHIVCPKFFLSRGDAKILFEPTRIFINK